MNRTRTLTTLIVTGSIACALLLAACGSKASSSGKATTNASATPTALSTTVVNTDFTSSDGAYTLKYPGGWAAKSITVSNTSGAAVFVSGDGNDLVEIEPLTVQVATSDYASLMQSFLQGAEATDTQVDATLHTLSAASGTWTGLQATATFNSMPSVITELGQDHNGNTTLIFTVAPTTTASSDGDTYFQPMLDSLTFVG